ncbi:MAG: segregation and condensation protein A [bacterium]|nr:MAG: segregation and condensation protein A [bacterium]
MYNAELDNIADKKNMLDYKVKLEVFEGPLDLLLHLIKGEEINIYDIPIAKITGQYFEYLDMMKELNLDIAGDFLVMAATLTYIKSAMLLPKPEMLDDDEGEDPREELVRRLIEYRKYKNAATSLRSREEDMSNSFSRNFISEWDENDADYLKEISVFQLLGAFGKLLAKTNVPQLYEVTLEDISVTEKMNVIMEKLSKTPRIYFEDLFDVSHNRMDLVGTFLAILELMKQQLLRVYQEKQFGKIWVQSVEAPETVASDVAASDVAASDVAASGVAASGVDEDEAVKTVSVNDDNGET